MYPFKIRRLLAINGKVIRFISVFSVTSPLLSYYCINTYFFFFLSLVLVLFDLLGSVSLHPVIGCQLRAGWLWMGRCKPGRKNGATSRLGAPASVVLRAAGGLGTPENNQGLKPSPQCIPLYTLEIYEMPLLVRWLLRWRGPRNQNVKQTCWIHRQPASS